MRISLRLTGAAVATLAIAVLIAPGPSASVPVVQTVAATSKPLNVVVVMADDMRADDLVFAPHLRALARQGLDFRNSFSPYPLCCPARASFLTGRYSHNHKVYWHSAPWGYGAFDDSRTLGTSLHDAGYQTGYVGKYLNRYGKAISQVSGRPSYRYSPNGWDQWIGALDGPNRNYPGSTYDFFHTSYNHNGRVETHREYSSRTIARYATNLVDRFHQRPAPFFLYVNFVAPHAAGGEPGDPKPVRRADGVLQEFVTTARPDWVKGRWNGLVNRAIGLPRGGGPSERDISDKPRELRGVPELNQAERVALREVTRQRAEAITTFDVYLQKVVDRLKATGEWENTVLFVTSDNGFFQGEHRRRTGKVLAYEPALRIPLIATGPGALRAGRDVYDPVSLVDLSATIVDLANAKPPRVSDGRSLLPAMLDGDVGWTIPVVTEATHTTSGGRAAGFDDARTSIGLRTARWSYTKYRDGFEELYDLTADPFELRNRVRDPAAKPVLRQLRQLWWRFKDCRGAECRVALPASLAASATQERAFTDAWWAAQRRVYGFGS